MPSAFAVVSSIRLQSTGAGSDLVDWKVCCDRLLVFTTVRRVSVFFILPHTRSATKFPQTTHELLHLEGRLGDLAITFLEASCLPDIRLVLSFSFLVHLREHDSKHCFDKVRIQHS